MHAKIPTKIAIVGLLLLVEITPIGKVSDSRYVEREQMMYELKSKYFMDTSNRAYFFFFFFFRFEELPGMIRLAAWVDIEYRGLLIIRDLCERVEVV